MNIQTLHVFGDTLVTPEIPFAAFVTLQKEAQPLLALAYFEEKKETGFFVLIDVQEKTIFHTILFSNKYIMALRMMHNASLRWSLIEDINSTILMFHSISLENQQNPLVETLLITHDYYDIHPTQFVDVDMGGATLLYLRRPDWDQLPELLRSRVFFQEQQVQMKSLASADSFLVATAKETTVLLLLKSTFLQNHEPLITQHFFLVCYDKYLNAQDWKYTFEEGFSLVSQEEVFDLSVLQATAMLIAGPVFAPTGQTTWIVGIAATRTQPNVGQSGEQGSSVVKQVSHLVWIRTDGELLQRSLDPVFLRVHLCVSGAVVVGVDQTNEQWRVWNWFPQNENRLHTILPLEMGVQRAYVVAKEQEEGQEAQLWLVEQHPHEVRISCRFAETLEKISSDVSIPHVTLLAQELYGDVLDWHMPVGLLLCGKTLIVTGVDSENHLALYQIE